MIHIYQDAVISRATEDIVSYVIIFDCRGLFTYFLFIRRELELLRMLEQEESFLV